MAALYGKRTPTGHAERGPGLIHLCYGTGVGKTSRAVGLAVRAAGRGLTVRFVQFMKSPGSGEMAVLAGIPGIACFNPGPHPWVLAEGPGPEHYDHARRAMAEAAQAAGRVDVMICDELLNAVLFKIFTAADVLALMDQCRGRTELLLTGSAAPPELIDAADYATEFVEVKHPYSRGINARDGIEH